MKFALFTGCVAKGATRELMISPQKAAEALGIEFVEMKSAACCGAGVLSEQSPILADAINARTFSIAEEQNLDLITICSTCQGVLKKSECHINGDSEYKEKINHLLSKGGHQYMGGKSKIKHFANILATEEGLNLLREKVKHPLTGLKTAAFYGCYVLRPSELSEYEDPDNPTGMEDIFEALGATGTRSLACNNNSSRINSSRAWKNSRLIGFGINVNRIIDSGRSNSTILTDLRSQCYCLVD